MRAMRPRRTTALQGFALGLCALIAFGALACGGSTPTDMWITKDPDAGSDFDAPMREAAPSDAGDSAGSGGAAGNMGTAGAGGDMGAAGAGGSGGAAGDMGTAGAAGDTGGGAGTSGSGGTST